MEKRRCGRSDISLSVVGVGCWSFGGGLTLNPRSRRMWTMWSAWNLLS